MPFAPSHIFTFDEHHCTPRGPRAAGRFFMPGRCIVNKHNHLLEHLRNPKFKDAASRLILSENSKRLYASYQSWPGKWHDIARIIKSAIASPITYFPDANIMFRDDTEDIWTALRIVALGACTPSTMLTPVVEAEIKPWLEEPWHNQERAAMIRTALETNSWASRYCIDIKSSLYRALLSYCSLLATRRSLTWSGEDGLTIFGTDPEAKSETMNAINTYCGPRALNLARKGRIDRETTGTVNVDDELHCMMAIAYSLTTGRESVILTADEDVLEIFWKAQWFLDTHYRAWLAASMVRDGQYGIPIQELKDTRGYFDGPLVLYARHTTTLREVLPPIYNPINVHVCYVAPDNIIHDVSFCFEERMIGLLEMRAKTNGCCTDIFGEKNIHVDLAPLKLELNGQYLGIGQDVYCTLEIAGTINRIARLDWVHSISCRERTEA
jgi:hypothetical protein